ncbi:LysE family transporter [Mycobacterium sp. NPDC003449]
MARSSFIEDVNTVVNDWHRWLGFFGTSVAVCFSPGAGAVQSLTSGLHHGLVRSYWSIAGQELGLILQLTLAAVGLGAVVAGSVVAFTVVKFAGVLYLLYLAVRQWRAAGGEGVRVKEFGARPGLPLLGRGFMVNATNPKALVFYLAVLPQFIAPAAPPVAQYVVLGATFVAVDIVVMSVYAALATRLLPFLGARRRYVDRVFAGLFATAAVVLALVHRSEPV